VSPYQKDKLIKQIKNIKLSVDRGAWQANTSNELAVLINSIENMKTGKQPRSRK
jgi:hypothetical protein